MAKRLVTLYIDDASLRLMQTEGKVIKEWVELPLEPGLIKNNTVVKEAEFTAKLQQFLKDQQVTNKKVVLGISGLRCLSRPLTFPLLPKEMLGEAVKREAKRVLPVPPEQLYISWQIIPAPEGKTQVFLVAVPRTIVDALVKALHRTGLRPSSMDLKPLLMARAAKEAAAVIVDVQSTEFDIVIMSGGVPQPVRTVSFAEEKQGREERLTMIKNELDRTITFFNSNNPDKVLVESVPIYTSGELVNEPEIRQSLSNELKHPVLSVPPPLECPSGFDSNRYMVNMDLALQSLSGNRGVGASVVNLNVLPITYQPKPVSMVRVLALPAAAVAIGLILFMVMLIRGASADVASVRTKLTAAEQQVQQRTAQRQTLVNSNTAIEKKISEAEATINNYTAAFGTLEKQSVGINRDLEEVTIKSVLGSIALSNVSHDNTVLRISGRASNEWDVLSYLKGLENSARFGEITITSMTRNADGGVNFSILGSFGQRSGRASGIELAIRGIPTDATLTSVNYNNGTLTIEGSSPDKEKVLSYLRYLDESGKFIEIDVTRISTTESGLTNFSLFLKIGG